MLAVDAIAKKRKNRKSRNNPDREERDTEREQMCLKRHRAEIKHRI